ncbi:MAG: winged helix-turn-helix domain-containing protein, partial [Campylobacterota bacterium]|nr:winged helix-turn-helix domain-containing protein [Campylobacterota bacterium]
IVILSAHKDEKFLFEAIPLQIMKYFVKPISFDDFEILIKDVSNYFKDYMQVVNIGKDIKYDYQKKSIFIEDDQYYLTKRERYFIELLIKNKHKITTKEDIQIAVWQDTPMSDAALKNMILRLRKKINKDIFLTIQNIGYKLS